MPTTIIITVLLLFAIISIIIFSEHKKSVSIKKNIYEKIQEEWNSISAPENDNGNIENLKENYKYFDKSNEYEIDDITWNDMEMDGVFIKLNYTKSFMGEAYLYNMLRNPTDKIASLKERERISDLFYNNKELRERKLYQLIKIGKNNRLYFEEYKNIIKDLKLYKKSKHIIYPVIFFLTLLIIPFNIIIGISLSLLSLFFDIYSYYQDKAKIENYIPMMVQLGSMLNSVKGLNEKTNFDDIDKYTRRLNDSIHLTKKYNRYIAKIRTMINGNHTEFDVAVDYIRIITHMDLIAFINLKNYINENMVLIQRCYQIVGYIDSMISIAIFKRQYHLKYEGRLFMSRPELAADEKGHLRVIDGFNPLLEKPVVNSFDIRRPALVTGSNATGKSTFLRTVGINAILAQTVFVVCAREYSSSLFKIYSSMNIKDDIFRSSSYYMTEIRSIKRILDASDNNLTILCCLDEVLRGTNTIERIGAASEILESLAQKNVLSIVSTHDIELSYILENYYENYHFQEKITQNDIVFDYCLYQGRSYSRNAIHLLKILGYSDDIISNSIKKVNTYIDTGRWS